MDAILFYHQKRRDGGVRTGVEFNGERILENFLPGAAEFNSALEWWVDIRLESDRLPRDAEEIRDWLIANAAGVISQLDTMADELGAGVDTHWPFRKEIRPSHHRYRGEIVCSAIRLLTGQKIGALLRELAENWVPLVSSLHALSEELK